jgi:hypothetical protein
VHQVLCVFSFLNVFVLSEVCNLYKCSEVKGKGKVIPVWAMEALRVARG